MPTCAKISSQKMTKQQGLSAIIALVARFKDNTQDYKKTSYNETQTRRDFIDPFFKALGWDIDNELGLSESYREVVHEDRIKIEGRSKAPDYSFRLNGGARLFFVEAKKPSIDIKDDIQPAYQVRRYGWTAKLNVSLITDFEEFAVYDCNKKPKPTDKASTARVEYLRYEDYEKKWDFLWDNFSKDAVLNGNFEKYLLKNIDKKGTETVDKDFLKSLDTWRTMLAEVINADNNKKDGKTARLLDEDELNFVVQQTLDRIIFLRIAEARDIEVYGSLKATIKTGNYFQNLLKLFQEADQKYNSGLFDFQKDKISDKIKISNDTIKTIITNLYYPESPYAFSVLSVEILGSAYEQFLGKTITINDKGKAVIELKPEVRKAGGVYYTPQYVVDYIVENTVGKLISPKTTPAEIANIKIVDPACGSGSFLLGAYQFLLTWHLSFYLKNPKEAKKNNALTPTNTLTTSEKKKILLNNIFGVDIDTNAVEVTKLSLLLKCMEGETSASIEHQKKLFNERVLPTLDSNIQSGNSLIDIDYYENQMDFGEERKIKPFSWKKAFPSVFKTKIIEEDLQAYHITCVMHNTRTSQRMITHNVKKGIPEYLYIEEEQKLLEIICLHIQENKLRILALNVCADHFHFAIVCNPEKLTTIVGKLKAMSARAFNIWRGITETMGHAPLPKNIPLHEEQTEEEKTRGHAPLPKNTILPRGETQNSLWAQKFNRQEIKDEDQLWNILSYIQNNRVKHQLPDLPQETISLMGKTIISYDKAYEPEKINGGFDVVIGNPPYVRMSDENQIRYFNQKYKYQNYQYDLYLLFLEQCKHLLIEKGLLGVIIPNTWLQSIKFQNIRKYLATEYSWNKILHITEHIFKAVVDTHVIIFEKNKTQANTIQIDKLTKGEVSKYQILSKDDIATNGDIINILANKNDTKLFNKIKENSLFIGDVCFSTVGVKPFQKGKGKPKQTEQIVIEKPFVKEKQPKPKGNNWLPLMRGSLMHKYINFWDNDSWIQYGEWLAEPRKPEVFAAEEKIIVRQTGDSIIAMLIGKNIIARNNLHILISEKIAHKFILGILNSKLTDFYYYQINPEKGEVLAEVKKNHVEQLPIPKITKQTQNSHDQIVVCVEQLLLLHKELQAMGHAPLSSKEALIKNKIAFNEDKINRLVYALYALTEEEIAIIEGV